MLKLRPSDVDSLRVIHRCRRGTIDSAVLSDDTSESTLQLVEFVTCPQCGARTDRFRLTQNDKLSTHRSNPSLPISCYCPWCDSLILFDLVKRESLVQFMTPSSLKSR